jgi:DNA invertase Pin-like site-specific DNA recombinase
MTEPTRAGAYYRMSDDRQENSIERQHSQVEPYARAKGYVIVREYIDLGITGSEVAKRKEFQRMLRDAQAGAFEVILCDDKDRFGRFDSIDSGEIVAPLRRKGVRLDTVAQGLVDWESFSGRITDAVLQEAKRLEQEAISRRTLTDQLLRAQGGKDTGGRPLYGYRREPDPVYVSRLVPDGLKADVVRLIFRLYDEGHTLAAVAEELYRRGVPSPRGKARWTRSVVQRILMNRRYVGDKTWGVRASGKCHRYGKEGVRATRRGALTQDVNPADGWVVRPDTHEPLVDRATFQRVQARLRHNRELKTPRRNGGDFVLSRLLVCGHCGSVLVGATRRRGREYLCCGYLTYGKGYCQRNNVPEAAALRAILGKLRDAFLDPDNLQRLRAEVAELEAQRRGDGNLRLLRARSDELARKIDQGNENLAVLPADRIPGVVAKLREWEKDREAVLAELREAESGSPVEDLERRIKAAEEALWTLQEAVQAEDLPLLRQVLQEMLVKAVLYWTHEERGRLTFSRVHRGELYLQTSGEVFDMSPSAGR